MAIILVAQPANMNGNAIDSQSILWLWKAMNGGDEGAPIKVWAWPRFAWQLTGYSGDDINAPITPVEADRAVKLLGSNDGHCWGEIDTIYANPAGMAAETGDPLRLSDDDGAFMMIKPVVLGSVNPAGPDCSLLLFVGRLWAPYGK